MKIFVPTVSWTIQHEPLDENHPHYQHPPITVYKFRWYILFTECMLNLVNSFMFSSYAPVANYTDQYYGASATDYLSMVFLGVSVPAMIIAILVAQKAGLKLLIISSAFLNAAGAGIRILSNINHMSADLRLTLVLMGQAFGALANPGTLFLNTKIAATWFPISQRALATSLLTVATPLGMLVTSPLATAVVHSPNDLILLNLIIFVPSALVFFMTLAIHRSEPLTAPSHTSSHALHQPLGTFEGIKKILTIPAYWVLLICLGVALGIFNTLYTMIQQILCSRGYDDAFSSLTFSLLIAGGLLGSTVAGVVVGRTKRFDEIIKITVCLATLAGILFAEFAILPDKHIPILVSMFFYGLFGLTFYAVSMEASAEITFPVEETTSSGILGLAGQLCGVLFIAIWNNLTQELPDSLRNTEKCSLSGQLSGESNIVAVDMKLPILVFHIIGAITAVSVVVFFKPKYVRLQQEQADIKKEDEEILSRKPSSAVHNNIVKF